MYGEVMKQHVRPLYRMPVAILHLFQMGYDILKHLDEESSFRISTALEHTLLKKYPCLLSNLYSLKKSGEKVFKMSCSVQHVDAKNITRRLAAKFTICGRLISNGLGAPAVSLSVYHWEGQISKHWCIYNENTRLLCQNSGGQRICGFRAGPS